MKYHIVLIIILWNLLSCDKVDLKNELEFVTGEYEWYYSYKGVGDSFNAQNQTEKYGIRIKNNSKLCIFRNGEAFFKGTIDVATYNKEGGLLLMAGPDDNRISLIYKDNQLEVQSIPMFGYINYFKRIK